MHPGRKCQAGVKFSGRSTYDGGPKRVEKCLRPPVLPVNPSYSHRWRATYYQQEASWHLLHKLLNNISHFLLCLIPPSSSALFPSLPLPSQSISHPIFSYAVPQKRAFLKWSFMLTSWCIFYSPFSKLVWGTGWQTRQPSDTAGIYLCCISFHCSFFSFVFWRANWIIFLGPQAFCSHLKLKHSPTVNCTVLELIYHVAFECGTFKHWGYCEKLALHWYTGTKSTG